MRKTVAKDDEELCPMDTPRRGDAPTASSRKKRWWEEGEEPDYRETLANERTFLAWSRTALAFLAGALAVLRLSGVAPYALRLALTCYLILLAVGAAAVGYVQWRARLVHMRRQEPLGHSGLQAAFLLAFVGLAGLVTAAVVIAAH